MHQIRRKINKIVSHWWIHVELVLLLYLLTTTTICGFTVKRDIAAQVNGTAEPDGTSPIAGSSDASGGDDNVIIQDYESQESEPAIPYGVNATQVLHFSHIDDLGADDHDEDSFHTKEHHEDFIISPLNQNISRDNGTSTENLLDLSKATSRSDVITLSPAHHQSDKVTVETTSTTPVTIDLPTTVLPAGETSDAGDVAMNDIKTDEVFVKNNSTSVERSPVVEVMTVGSSNATVEVGEKRAKFLVDPNSDFNTTLPSSDEVWALAGLKNVGELTSNNVTLANSTEVHDAHLLPVSESQTPEVITHLPETFLNGNSSHVEESQDNSIVDRPKSQVNLSVSTERAGNDVQSRERTIFKGNLVQNIASDENHLLVDDTTLFHLNDLTTTSRTLEELTTEKELETTTLGDNVATAPTTTVGVDEVMTTEINRATTNVDIVTTINTPQAPTEPISVDNETTLTTTEPIAVETTTVSEAKPTTINPMTTGTADEPSDTITTEAVTSTSLGRTTTQSLRTNPEMTTDSAGQASTFEPTFVEFKPTDPIHHVDNSVESNDRVITTEYTPKITTTDREEFKHSTVVDEPTTIHQSFTTKPMSGQQGVLITPNPLDEGDLFESTSQLPLGTPSEIEDFPPENETDINAIIAISVSAVGVVALILLVGFLIIMRKRQKQLTYGQRCRPVGLDAYSLDNISIYNSVRRKGVLRASKRAYGNAAFDDPALQNNQLTISQLAAFVQKKTAIYDEFKEVPLVTARIDEVPAGCEEKNRYANVVPLPESRVHLKQLDDDERTEYINANFVKGPKDTTHYYIACQAPLENTVIDFWRMIWEQNSRVIIMATDLTENGVEKCAEYLPASFVLDNNVVFGDYQVILKNREVKEKYAVSSIHLKNAVTKTWREITHLWYQWPDKGTPTDEASIIAMLLEARSYLKMNLPEQSNGDAEQDSNLDEKTGNGAVDKSKSLQRVQGPLTVHCSPGTGRTGTIIACDIAVRSLEQPKRSVDIPQTVYVVRRGRASAVQTREQYEFIYKVAHMYATKLTGPINEN